MAGLLSTRPSAPWLHCRVVAAAAAVLGLLACGALLAPVSTPAQEFQFPKRPPSAKKSQVATGQKQMLVQANEIIQQPCALRLSAHGKDCGQSAPLLRSPRSASPILHRF